MTDGGRFGVGKKLLAHGGGKLILGKRSVHEISLTLRALAPGTTASDRLGDSSRHRLVLSIVLKGAEDVRLLCERYPTAILGRARPWQKLPAFSILLGPE
jgi:hypothetical protein